MLEEYLALTHRRNFNLLHAELMDIDLGLALLRKHQPKAWAILILCGKHSLDRRTVAELIGYRNAEPAQVQRLYHHGIKVLTQLMNTGRRR